MRVNLAAQILSHSAVAGISFLVKVKELQDDAMSTEKFPNILMLSSTHLTAKHWKAHKGMEVLLMAQVIIMHS